jgi:hypothetical protein
MRPHGGSPLHGMEAQVSLTHMVFRSLLRAIAAGLLFHQSLELIRSGPLMALALTPPVNFCSTALLSRPSSARNNPIRAEMVAKTLQIS